MVYRNGYRGAHRRQSARPVVRANKYEAPCRVCGETVPAETGIWESATRQVRHLPMEWNGSPVSGKYINGCPGEADRINEKGGFGRKAG